MSPTNLLLNLIPNASSLVELAHWLDAEGATSRLSIYIDSTSARSTAESILDGVHSEEALSILVEHLCKLRPRREGEIRDHLTYSAILQERNPPSTQDLLPEISWKTSRRSCLLSKRRPTLAPKIRKCCPRSIQPLKTPALS